jgi:TonB-dependent starch-binding outer membrane protein SusC
MKKQRLFAHTRAHTMHQKILAMLVLVMNVFPIKAQTAAAIPIRSSYQLQEQLEELITLYVKNEKLETVLDILEKKTKLVFVYANDEIDVNQKISLAVNNKPAQEVFKQLLTPIGINYLLVKDKIILQASGIKSPLTDGSNSDNTSIKTQDRAVAAEVNNFTVTGTVTDETGKALELVNVSLKGGSLATFTDAKGNYSLSLPDNAKNGTLRFSIVGYISQELKITGKNTINVVLVSDTKELTDVVVVGYGTQKKVSVTGSVDVVGKKAIDGRPVTNLTTALQGTSPNLIIQQRNFEPGQGVNINIRGLGTLGDNTPLVVIDGIMGGDINLINPTDIESVTVLKDAGAAAIYGSRSANGVLLVTTKKGRKNAAPKLTYSGIYGVQSPRITYTPVDAWENAYYKNESLANSGLSPAFTPGDIQAFRNNGNGDWRVDNILQKAVQQSHNLSLSGGGENSTYMLSLGMLDQKNNLVGPGYGYKRYNIRLNQSTEFGRFKLNTILSYVKVQGKDHSFGTGTILVDATRVPLYYSFQDTAGNYLTNPVSAQFNPKGILEKGGYRRSNDDEIFGSLKGEYAITKNLKLHGVFGGTVRSNTLFSRRLQVNFIPGGVYGNDRETLDFNLKSLFTNVQAWAQYDKKINAHEIVVLVGASNESEKNEQSQVVKTLTDPNLGIPTTGTVVSPTGSFNTLQRTFETSLSSVFGRAGYSFKNKYFAEFNFRYDGSSKFPASNRWGFFPSVSAAWRISQEDFFKSLSNKINELKLYTSYGILGNQNVSAYQYQTTFGNEANMYGFNNVAVGGSRFFLGNPELTWEKSATFNLGINMVLLKRKLEVSFEYFNKRTSDILYQRRDVPQIFGAGFPDYNVAEVLNRGWDLRVTYNHNGRHFRHSFMLNLADNLNELKALSSGATQQVERKEEFEILRRIGQPITVYYGYRTNGFYQNLDDINKYPKFAGSTVTAGDLKFVDRNGDGVIDDADKYILGNPFPRYTFGFTYTVAYKNFDASVFIQGVGRRDAMLRGEQVEPFHFGYGGTMYKHQTDYWTPTNPNARYPRLAEAGSPSNSNNYRTGSDVYLFDAAYIRVKNMQVGYTLPATIAKKAKMEKLRIYFTAQNFLTLSNLNFIDPEITEFDNNTGFNTGANSARSYFMPVFVGGGIDITF